MENKCIVRKRSHNMLKINMDLWSTVADFITEKYTEYSVKIVTPEVEETTFAMDDAYEKICQYTEDITSINISAASDDEKLDIDIVNRVGEYFKYTIKLEAECKDEESAAAATRFMNEISKGSDLFAFGVLLAFGILGIFIINFLSFVFSGISIGMGLKIAIVLCVYVVLGISGTMYMHVMVNKTWNVHRLQFWTSYWNIVRYRRMKSIGYIYAAITLFFATLLFLVGFTILQF